MLHVRSSSWNSRASGGARGGPALEEKFGGERGTIGAEAGRWSQCTIFLRGGVAKNDVFATSRFGSCSNFSRKLPIPTMRTAVVGNAASRTPNLVGTMGRSARRPNGLRAESERKKSRRERKKERERESERNFLDALEKKKTIFDSPPALVPRACEMPSLQATAADDALPQTEGHDAAPPVAPSTTSGGGGEEEDEQRELQSAAANARALLACSAASWPLSLRRLSFATELLELPADVAEWMRSGGRVYLPEGSAAVRLLVFESFDKTFYFY